ncbi:hypothetical protein C8Q74DRAFT_1364328 [Fomes fomentarius]|nr:hypothetical protein C8Q74DRAFT_1364328 [Fomes fomentarius]
MDCPSPALPPSTSSPFGMFKLGHASVDGLSCVELASWPCEACRPYIQFFLGQPTFTGARTAPGPSSAFSSPFSDYVWVPALIPRSQLALYNTSTAPVPTFNQPASPVCNPINTSQPVSPDAGTDVSGSSTPPSTLRKTRGVKIACTNCQYANKKCDEGRPCRRCVVKGLGDTCVSAERKQRRRAVRQLQTATAAITVSATEVELDAPSDRTGEVMPISTSIPIQTATSVYVASGTSYVDDSHEMADGASTVYSYSESVSSSSPVLTDSLDVHLANTTTIPSSAATIEDDNNHDLRRNDGNVHAPMQVPNCSFYAEFWPVSPAWQHQQHQQQYSGWDYSVGVGVDLSASEHFPMHTHPDAGKFMSGQQF